MDDSRSDRAEVLGSVMKRFIASIDNTIRQTLSSRIRAFPPPNESTIFQSAVWSLESKPQSSLPALDVIEPETSPKREEERLIRKNMQREQPDIVSEMISDIQSHVHSPSLSHTDVPLARASSQDNVAVPLEASARQSTGLPNVEAQLAHCPKTCHPHRLAPGHSLQIELLTPHQPLRVKTKRIHLTLTFDDVRDIPPTPNHAITSQNMTMAQPSERMCTRLKYLDPRECPHLSAEAMNMLDLDLLAEGSEVVLDQYIEGIFKEVYLYKKSDMVFVQCWKERSPACPIIGTD